jgi:hypothetical protein
VIGALPDCLLPICLLPQKAPHPVLRTALSHAGAGRGEIAKTANFAAETCYVLSSRALVTACI